MVWSQRRKAGWLVTRMTHIMVILITTITSVTAGIGPPTQELGLPQSMAFSLGPPSAPWQRYTLVPFPFSGEVPWFVSLLHSQVQAKI